MSIETRPADDPGQAMAGSMTVPLHSTTWELDREEGAVINDMKATHIDPYARDCHTGCS